MATSRIFVRNLPPSLTEQDFRSHFSKFSPPTDVRFFNARRIGYIGYQTPEDAVKAVRYFNKSFIRMSKIAVEIARPKEEITAPTARSQHGARPRSDSAKAITSPDASERASLKRKRDEPAEEVTDPKLKEYLDIMQAPSKQQRWADGAVADLTVKAPTTDETVPVVEAEDASDDEYEQIQKPSKKSRQDPKHELDVDESDAEDNGDQDQMEETRTEAVARKPQSDLDWLQSKQKKPPVSEKEDNFMDDRDTQPTIQAPGATQTDGENPGPAQDGSDQTQETAVPDEEDTQVEAIRKSRRLFLRNLPYTAIEDDLRDHFSAYGTLQEVHLSIDGKTGKSKGFAFIEFADADAAIEAYRSADSQTFQGRILHIIPGSEKRENKLDEFAVSKLPLKVQKQIQRKSQAASSTFNWNALYMNADAVVSSISARLGIDKSEVLDPTSSDAAVKQALAETHIISETKSYFATQGVDLEAFKSKRRGDTAILVKNFPYGTNQDELRKMFEDFGTVKRFLMPPTGTIAIVEFAVAPEARAAYKSLAYRRIKDSILFLEPAPKDLFTNDAPQIATATTQLTDIATAAKPTVSDLLREEETGPIETTSLFVKNLSFATTTEKLTEAFSPLTGFVSARVKTRSDPKNLGSTLSMGFGFLEFRSKEDASTALAAMNGYNLDGHKLDIRASQRALDAAEDQRKSDRQKAQAGRRTKIVIKNLPFQASKKEIRALFSTYGQLRSVRVPKKFDSTSRGFAFAEFTTPREAANAVDALRNTHLLGRKLVLDFAEEEAEDAEAEIERMQKKVGAQTDKLALQRLTGGGRKKFDAEVANKIQDD